MVIMKLDAFMVSSKNDITLRTVIVIDSERSNCS